MQEDPFADLFEDEFRTNLVKESCAGDKESLGRLVDILLDSDI